MVKLSTIAGATGAQGAPITVCAASTGVPPPQRAMETVAVGPRAEHMSLTPGSGVDSHRRAVALYELHHDIDH